MIEVIPNWHPVFVHFTVALFSISVGFYVLSYLTARFKVISTTLALEFEIVARWCLWAVGFITIVTIFAGLYAYSTVKHDELSHLAMTSHRNWAIPTAIGIWIMAAWSMWRYYKQKTLTLIFIIPLLIVQGLLLSTAWRGAELVFRHGLGVMSLPQAEEVGHNHHPHEEKMAQPNSPPKTSDSNEPQQDNEQDEHVHD